MLDVSLRSIHNDCRVEVPVVVPDEIFYGHVRLSLRIERGLHFYAERFKRSAAPAAILFRGAFPWPKSYATRARDTSAERKIIYFLSCVKLQKDNSPTPALL